MIVGPVTASASSTSRTRVSDATAEIERIYREEYGRVVASLVRRFGDIDIAEEAAGEALLLAVEKWPVDGVPPNPGGWLTTTAGNRGDRPDPPRVPPRRQAPAGRHDRRPGTPRADRPRLRRPAAADLHVLPPGPRARGEGGADPAPARWPHRRRDRRGVLRARDDDGAAAHPRQAEDQGRQDPLPGPRPGRPGRPRLGRARGRLPRLQRGLPLDIRRRAGACGPDRRGDPARPGAARAAARHPRGGRPAGADAPDRGPAHGPGGRRRAGPAARAGPRRLGPRR